MRFLDLHTCGEHGTCNQYSRIRKELHFLFEVVWCLVAIRTSTSSNEIKPLGFAIAQRFSCHSCHRCCGSGLPLPEWQRHSLSYNDYPNANKMDISFFCTCTPSDLFNKSFDSFCKCHLSHILKFPRSYGTIKFDVVNLCKMLPMKTLSLLINAHMCI